jgi:hypothetical protein
MPRGHPQTMKIVSAVKKLNSSGHPGENRGPVGSSFHENTGFRLEFIPMKIGAGMTLKRTKLIFHTFPPTEGTGDSWKNMTNQLRIH